MKKIIILMILSFLQTEITYASKGRTDSNGCHYSKEEGRHCYHKKSKPSRQNYSSSNINYSGNDHLAEAAAILIVAGVVYGVGKAIDAFSSDQNTSNNTIDASNKSKTVIETNNYTQNNNEVIQINSPTNNKIAHNNSENIEDIMNDLFGVYIGQVANTDNLKKVGELYEMKSSNDLLGFDKYTVAFKYEKVISLSSNKNVSVRGCTKEKETLKQIMEDNFGNQYKITIAKQAYLLNYPSFVSMISCQEDKLSFVLKGK
jgi:hypothetical protein